MSPSAVTRVVQRLERELKTILLIRTNREVRLTPEGDRFREYAAQAVADWESVERTIRSSAQELEGALSIFATVTACYSFLPRLLEQFHSTHPHVELRIETGNALEALSRLQDGEVDMSVAAVPDRLPRGIHGRTITNSRLAFFAPTMICEANALTAARHIQWDRVPLILPRAGLGRQLVDEWFRSARIKPRIGCEENGNEAIMALTAVGTGVGVLPELVVEQSPLRDRVRKVPCTPPLPEFRIALCCSRAHLDAPLQTAFFESLESSTIA